MENQPFDIEIRDLLQETYTQALLVADATIDRKKLRLMIVATSLESLAKTFLAADSNPDTIAVNLKQAALGLLGTADWVKEDLD